MGFRIDKNNSIAFIIFNNIELHFGSTIYSNHSMVIIVNLIPNYPAVVTVN